MSAPGPADPWAATTGTAAVVVDGSLLARAVRAMSLGEQITAVSVLCRGDLEALAMGLLLGLDAEIELDDVGDDK